MSDRYPGGLIRKTPPTITPPVDGEGGSAPGIWTLEQASYYEGTGEWPKPVLSRELYSAGENLFGQLGINNNASQSSPVQIGSGTTWNAISANYNTAMATTTDRKLYYWGQGNAGRSGTGVENPNSVSSPVQIGALTNWSTMTVLSETVVAVKTDGTLWSWGGNSYGEQGRNNTASSSSPSAVGSLTDWSVVHSGETGAVVALKTDSTIWTWGRDQFGMLGQNTLNINKSSPTQVGAGTDWYKIASGSYHMGAIKTNGTLWLWGSNDQGQLGQNNKVYVSSPVQVGALTTWASLTCGRAITMAVKTDGTLWAWGRNGGGSLGINNTIPRSSPVQVGSQTNWKTPSVSRYSSIVTKTDGTMWSWGANFQGELGRTNLAYSSSPIQVGSETNWDFATGTKDEGFSLFRTLG